MALSSLFAGFAGVVARSVCPAVLLVFELVARTAALCLCRGSVVLWMVVVTDVGVHAIFKVVNGIDECGDIRWLLRYCCCGMSIGGVLCVGVIDRESVELLEDFLDDVGGVVSVVVHTSGVGGACFLIFNLSSCKMLLEVFPCFVGSGLVVPLFDGFGEDTGIAEDDFSYADELRVGFRCTMGFR